MTGALADSTKKKYTAIQQSFMNFCANLNVSSCPATTDTVMRYLAWKKQSGSGVDTAGVLAALRNLHALNGMNTSGLNDPRIGLIRTSLARQVKVKEERAPISSADLRRIFLGLQEARAENRMLKAALSLGFFGLMRIGDITSSRQDSNPPLTPGSLSWSETFLEVKLWRSKTDRTLRGATVSVPRTGSLICPCIAMEKYLEVRPPAGHRSLFLWPDGNPLTSAALRSRLITECRRAGLVGNFNGHSLRIGGASALAARGVDIEKIMKLGRWRSDSVRRYLRNPSEDLARVASLLEN